MARRPKTPKPDHKRRSVQITFWVTPSEHARIDDNAERAGVTRSTYIRSLALGKPQRAKPKVRADALTRELSRIMNNFNQLQTHASAGKIEAGDSLDHVAARVSIALEHWATGEAKGAPAQSAIELLSHEGAKLNHLAHQANTGKALSERELLQVLHNLTDRLRPFCP